MKTEKQKRGGLSLGGLQALNVGIGQGLYLALVDDFYDIENTLRSDQEDEMRDRYGDDYDTPGVPDDEDDKYVKDDVNEPCVGGLPISYFL